LFCGLFSVFLGTFNALSQKRLKKLIIYSSIAQIGFLVAGLSTNTLGGFSAVIFFLITYIMTSILIWSHFSLFYSFQQNVSAFYERSSTSLFISSLTNFFSLNKLWSLSFIVIFFSIGGIPPLTGFLSKILILFEVINSGNILASALLIIISSISVFYYIRMVKIMFFEPKNLEKYYEKFQVIFYSPFLDTVYLISAFLLLGLVSIFFFPTYLLLLCQYIVLNISIF
jgi:NADH-quinone oxidoreductase subunit N